MFRLDDKVALITGAGSGIGEATAHAFAAAGAQVVIADIDVAAAGRVAASITDAGGRAHPLVVDVADEAQVQVAFVEIVGRFGRLDVAVNNAGIGHVGNVLETSVDDWERVMGVNARGIFLCAREAVRQMRAQQPAGGAIINIASVAALVALERRFPYSASKGAVLALTRSIAIDFVGDGIRCNAICPGTVHTPFVERFLAQSFAGQEDAVRQHLHARQPIGRMGRPEEIATAALYLASDEAVFVTGSALVIDGGLTAR
jgi:NAD(P)-dependent dehydrogenase (short-subunit alcohol dehydrogenase family)